MPADTWQELGIEPTKDAGLIRRAYASRLKAMGTSPDPVTFQRLREAYEVALREAGHGRPQAWSSSVRHDVNRSHTASDKDADAARAAIETALARNDAAAAFAAFETADDRGLLPIAELLPLEEKLLAAVAADRNLPVGALTSLVARFEWNTSIHPLRHRCPLPFKQLDARLDAERWYGELVERSRRPRGVFEKDTRLAARQLLAGPPNWARRFLFANRSPLLGIELRQLDQHADWIAGRLDAERIAWCRGRSTRRSAPRLLLGWLVGIVLFTWLTAHPGPASGFGVVAIVFGWLVVLGIRRQRPGRKSR